jgi:hypothetical protein
MGIRIVSTALIGCLPGLLAAAWSPAANVDGITVESRPTESGINVHRGSTFVCTDLGSLEAFVADTSGFSGWVPYTRSAELLQHTQDGVVYYVRSTTPWPLRDRDMVYRITRQRANESGVRLSLTGLPDYRPEVESVERMRAATGHWLLEPGDARIRVHYQLYLDPGAAPRIVVNRRLARVIGQTLANLSARFPCGAA